MNIENLSAENLAKMRRRIEELETTVGELREREEKYRSLVESTDDSIYLVDREYRYMFINKRHIERMGISGTEYLGRPYGDFHSTDETEWFSKKINEVFISGKSIRQEHKSLRDGKYFLLTLSPVKEPDGSIKAVTIVSKDINELKHMEDRLRTLSLTDDLTGLYNRRGFLALGEQQLKLAKRMGRGIFMLYADLDGLKQINDTKGHLEGDRAITITADILRKTFRDSDIIARIGGDEFVVIPVGVQGDNIQLVADRLQKIIDLHNSDTDRNYYISLSYGIAYYDPKDPCSIDDLISMGDSLMYQQKKSKNRT